jgi:hypothetical protein
MPEAIFTGAAVPDCWYTLYVSAPVIGVTPSLYSVGAVQVSTADGPGMTFGAVMLASVTHAPPVAAVFGGTTANTKSVGASDDRAANVEVFAEVGQQVLEFFGMQIIVCVVGVGGTYCTFAPAVPLVPVMTATVTPDT